MLFPWDKWKEKPLSRRNTLQIFITNRCNMNCNGCFARNIMTENDIDMSIAEYNRVVNVAKIKGVKQINLLGGEPLLHEKLLSILEINNFGGLKTTIYTNGRLINKWKYPEFFKNVKLRISLDCFNKTIDKIPQTNIPFDANYMVVKSDSISSLLDCAKKAEEIYKCKVFFIFSMRELDNYKKDFFIDTKHTMPVLEYKKLVHCFLKHYNGNMDIHISKRGVFESTKTIADCKCRFANYFIGGKIIQCPYDVVNKKFQNDYNFGTRNCQHNNTCLMSKVVYERK